MSALGAAGRIVAVGECMVELVDHGGGAATIGFGGDTLNSAVYLARLGVPVAYATVLGDDPYSGMMRAAWAEEGIALDAVAVAAGEVAGLYAIRVDGLGERHFTYWRRQAPVRRLFDWPGSGVVDAAIREAGLVLLSGITLMVLEPPQRLRLLDALKAAKARGAAIAFDSNYRARGWSSPTEAVDAMAPVIALADVVLPSIDDERTLRGLDDAPAVAAYYLACGVPEVVVKQAARGALVATVATRVPVPAVAVPQVIDSTAAGDAFNAGYLAARRAGAAPETAARRGAALAARVVQHRGAIVPQGALAGLEGMDAP
ncbi:MAG: sugar kinase [Silanimonas sp.]